MVLRRQRSHPLLDTLRSFPLFYGVDTRRLRKLLDNAQQVSVQGGELLMLERFHGEQFLIVLEGTASVHRHDDLIAAVGPGDFLGEIALLQGTDRSATVVARSAMKVLVFETVDFRSLLDELPEVASRIRERAVLRLAADDPIDL